MNTCRTCLYWNKPFSYDDYGNKVGFCKLAENYGDNDLKDWIRATSVDYPANLQTIEIFGCIKWVKNVAQRSS